MKTFKNLSSLFAIILFTATLTNAQVESTWQDLANDVKSHIMSGGKKLENGNYYFLMDNGSQYTVYLDEHNKYSSMGIKTTNKQHIVINFQQNAEFEYNLLNGEYFTLLPSNKKKAIIREVTEIFDNIVSYLPYHTKTFLESQKPASLKIKELIHIIKEKGEDYVAYIFLKKNNVLYSYFSNEEIGGSNTIQIIDKTDNEKGTKIEIFFYSNQPLSQVVYKINGKKVNFSEIDEKYFNLKWKWNNIKIIIKLLGNFLRGFNFEQIVIDLWRDYSCNGQTFCYLLRWFI